MNKYALVQLSDLVVHNIIVWDGIAPYTPPVGIEAVLIHGACNLGWVYDPATDSFSNPNPPLPA